MMKKTGKMTVAKAGSKGGAVRGKCKSRGEAHARRIATLRWFRQWQKDAEKRGDHVAAAEFRHRIARLEQKNGKKFV